MKFHSAFFLDFEAGLSAGASAAFLGAAFFAGAFLVSAFGGS